MERLMLKCNLIQGRSQYSKYACTILFLDDVYSYPLAQFTVKGESQSECLEIARAEFNLLLPHKQDEYVIRQDIQLIH